MNNASLFFQLGQVSVGKRCLPRTMAILTPCISGFLFYRKSA